jgi:hypothetical protein
LVTPRKTHPRWLLGALFGLVGAASWGCTKTPPPPFAVDRFQVAEDTLAAAPALGLGPSAFQKALQAAVTARGAAVISRGQSGPSGAVVYKLRGEVVSAREVEASFPDGGEGRLDEVALALELAPSKGGSDSAAHVLASGVGRVDAPEQRDPEAHAEAYQRAFQAALTQATTRLAQGAEARRKDTAALVADLTSPDLGRREAAADVLVDRKDDRATPVLIDELKSEDDRVRMKAVGGLVELKAQAAVLPLIELTHGTEGLREVDPRQLTQVIYAVGEIGGDDAAAFLFTMGSGHPDEAVRKAALEATAELRAQAAKPNEEKKTP